MVLGPQNQTGSCWSVLQHTARGLKFTVSHKTLVVVCVWGGYCLHINRHCCCALQRLMHLPGFLLPILCQVAHPVSDSTACLGLSRELTLLLWQPAGMQWRRGKVSAGCSQVNFCLSKQATLPLCYFSSCQRQEQQKPAIPTCEQCSSLSLHFVPVRDKNTTLSRVFTWKTPNTCCEK